MMDPDNSSRRPKRAAFGVIAQGQIAVGVVAMGGFAVGLVAIGGISIGIVAIGAISLGGLALGAVAIGWKTVGAISLGMVGAQAALPWVMRAVRPGSGPEAPPQNSTADSSSVKCQL
jgi:hypothetical protein